MKFTVKHFDELTKDELVDIYKLRVEVFVVEQECPYQEVDEHDKYSYHVWLRDENGIQAYLRVLPKGRTYDDVSIGRVISMQRRSGLGSELLQEGIRIAKEKFNAGSITIGAQVYARKFYEKAGFVQISDEYLDVGIPHIDMRLTL